MHKLTKIVNNSYYFLNKCVPILQNQKNNKFLHNLNYTNSEFLAKNTFEGYLNCGACCYLLSYYLEKHNIKTKMKKTAVYKNSRYFDHVYLEYNNLIIDPTYRQLFRDYDIQNNDLFMKKIYSDPYFSFIGDKTRLKKLITLFENHYLKTYNQPSFSIIKHYQNPVDISDKLDCNEVINNIDYARKKGQLFLNLHNSYNKI